MGTYIADYLNTLPVGGAEYTEVNSAFAGVMAMPRAPYLGQGVSRCFPALTNNASFTVGMSRSDHVASKAQTGPTVVFMNAYMASAGEHAPLGASGTLKVSIEYPAGTFTLANECLAGAAPFPAGLTSFTFPTSLRIPRRKHFGVVVNQVNAAGILWTNVGGGDNGYGNSPNDFMDIGTTPNDKTQGGTIGAANGICFFPVAMGSMTREASVAITGDSRQAGGAGGGVTDPSCDCGPVARIVGPIYGYSQWAISATAQYQWNAGSHTYFNQLVAAGWFTHVINMHAVNDIGNGNSVATVVAARATFAAACKAQKSDLVIIGGTIYPYNSSSDAFVSKANQTITGSNNVRTLGLNDNIRYTGIAGEDFVWDEADGIDPFREGRYPVSKDYSLASRTPASCASGTISGTTFTVSGTLVGNFNLGDYLYDAGGAITDGTRIISYISGTGGAGSTMLVSKPHSGFPYNNAVTATSITTAAQIARDGLHTQTMGEELIIKNKGPALLQLLAAA